jgi:hypothetical protein
MLRIPILQAKLGGGWVARKKNIHTSRFNETFVNKSEQCREKNDTQHSKILKIGRNYEKC